MSKKSRYFQDSHDKQLSTARFLGEYTQAFLDNTQEAQKIGHENTTAAGQQCTA